MYVIKKKYEDKFAKYLEEVIKLKNEGIKNEKISRFYDICYVLAFMIEGGMTRSLTITESIRYIILKENVTPDITQFLELLNKREEGSIDKYYFIATCNIDLNTIINKSFEFNGYKCLYIILLKLRPSFI